MDKDTYEMGDFVVHGGYVGIVVGKSGKKTYQVYFRALRDKVENCSEKRLISLKKYKEKLEEAYKQKQYEDIMNAIEKRGTVK